MRVDYHQVDPQLLISPVCEACSRLVPCAHRWTSLSMPPYVPSAIMPLLISSPPLLISSPRECRNAALQELCVLPQQVQLDLSSANCFHACAGGHNCAWRMALQQWLYRQLATLDCTYPRLWPGLHRLQQIGSLHRILGGLLSCPSLHPPTLSVCFYCCIYHSAGCESELDTSNANHQVHHFDASAVQRTMQRHFRHLLSLHTFNHFCPSKQLLESTCVDACGVSSAGWSLGYR